MQYQQILYDVKDRIATITLNRPEQLNAWTDVMAEEVWQATHAADADENVRVIVLTGCRPRVLRRRRHHRIQDGESAPADRQAAAAVRLQPSAGLSEPHHLLSFAHETDHRDAERRDRRHRPGSRAVLRSAFRSRGGGDHDGLRAHRSCIRVRHGLGAYRASSGTPTRSTCCSPRAR